MFGLGAAFAAVGGAIYAANTIEIESEVSGTITDYHTYTTLGDCADHCTYTLNSFVIDDEHAMQLGTPQLLIKGQFQSTQYADRPLKDDTTWRHHLPPSIEEVLAQGAKLEEGALRIGDEVNVTYKQTLAEVVPFFRNYIPHVQDFEVIGPVFDSFSID